MSIKDYLYKGAPAGERAAVQKAVTNMPYSTIGKNIVAEGGFGKGSNLRGFDPNFKGGTNLFNYVKGGISSLFGGKAPGNIGGGTPAQRQLFEKVLQSPIARTVGPIARTAVSLPFQAVALGPYGLSLGMRPKTEAGFDYMKGFDEGAITGVFDETAGLDDFENFGKGIMAADAAAIQRATSIDPEITAAIDAQTADEQAQLPIDPIDNRNIFSRIKDFAAPIAKDIAGRTIASQALGGAGGMIFGLPGALLGTIFGGLKGGGIFDAPYIGGVTTYDPITGRFYTGEELDKLNARGGYYTEIARAARRRDKSIANMKRRRDAGLRYGKNRLKKLEEEAAREEAARREEAIQMQQENRASAGTPQATGGYQSSFAQDRDFMEGPPGREAFSGDTDLSSYMGST